MSVGRLGLLLFLLSAAGGCTVHAVNPHPNVVIGANAQRVRVDCSALSDAQKLDGTWFTTIADIHKTLENGIRNAVGDKLAVAGQEGVVLKFTQLEFSLTQGLGTFISARFRAKWLGPNGQQLAEVSGVAKPRNPFESSWERHLEDVVEVMYEKLIDGYDRATNPSATPPPARPVTMQ